MIALYFEEPTRNRRPANAASFPPAPLPITSQLKEGLCGAALVDALQSDGRGLEENHFSGFSETQRLFFPAGLHTADTQQIHKDEESSVLGCAGRDDRPADGAR